MLLFVIIQQAPLWAILLLAVMVWLAMVEVWKRDTMTTLQKVWWVLLVLLTNFIGLIALRVWIYWSSRRESSDRSGG